MGSSEGRRCRYRSLMAPRHPHHPQNWPRLPGPKVACCARCPQRDASAREIASWKSVSSNIAHNHTRTESRLWCVRQPKSPARRVVPGIVEVPGSLVSGAAQSLVDQEPTGGVLILAPEGRASEPLLQSSSAARKLQCCIASLANPRNSATPSHNAQSRPRRASPAAV